MERREIQESEICEEEVEWWADNLRCEVRLFHKAIAEWKDDMLEMFRPEMTEGQLSVVRDEERV